MADCIAHAQTPGRNDHAHGRDADFVSAAKLARRVIVDEYAMTREGQRETSTDA